MRIRILGSGAAEGFPALFCECETCRRARAIGGRNLRTRTSVQVDESVLIDLPPDILSQVQREGFSLASVEHILITHSHRDHFAPAELHLRREPSAHWENQPPLYLYGTDHTCEVFRETFGEPPIEQGVHFNTIHPFVSFAAGDMFVLPIPASHSSYLNPVNYILFRRGRTLLAAFDTGWYSEQTWSALNEWQFDVLVAECTTGHKSDPMNEHLSVHSVKRMHSELKRRGCLKDTSRFVTVHFSHDGGLLHEDLERVFCGTGIEVGYDGMVVEVPD